MTCDESMYCTKVVIERGQPTNKATGTFSSVVYEGYGKTSNAIKVSEITDGKPIEDYVVEKQQAYEHGNIVEHYGYLRKNSLLHLSMRRYQCNLECYITQTRANLVPKMRPSDELILILRDIAHAVNFLHSRGEICTHLKPRNILIQHGRAFLDPVIEVSVEKYSQDITWFSPEECIQVTDLRENAIKESGSRLGMYRLALVMYYCFAGKTLFSTGSPRCDVKLPAVGGEVENLLCPLLVHDYKARKAAIDLDHTCFWFSIKRVNLLKTLSNISKDEVDMWNLVNRSRKKQWSGCWKDLIKDKCLIEDIEKFEKGKEESVVESSQGVAQGRGNNIVSGGTRGRGDNMMSGGTRGRGRGSWPGNSTWQRKGTNISGTGSVSPSVPIVSGPSGTGSVSPSVPIGSGPSGTGSVSPSDSIGSGPSSATWNRSGTCRGGRGGRGSTSTSFAFQVGGAQGAQTHETQPQGFTTVASLLHLIRNSMGHSNRLLGESIAVLAKYKHGGKALEENIEKYYSSVFPKLIMHLREEVRKHKNYSRNPHLVDFV